MIVNHTSSLLSQFLELPLHCRLVAFLCRPAPLLPEETGEK